VIERTHGLLADEDEAYAVDRVSFLAEVMPPEQVPDFLERVVGEPTWPESGPDLPLLGVAAGLPVASGPPAAAREALLALLRGLLSSDAEPARGAAVLAALERALEGLHARGERTGGPGDALLSELESLLREHREAKLVQEMRRRSWPLPPRVELRPPGADERRLDPARLGLR